MFSCVYQCIKLIVLIQNSCVISYYNGIADSILCGVCSTGVQINDFIKWNIHLLEIL